MEEQESTQSLLQKQFEKGLYFGTTKSGKRLPSYKALTLGMVHDEDEMVEAKLGLTGEVLSNLLPLATVLYGGAKAGWNITAPLFGVAPVDPLNDIELYYISRAGISLTLGAGVVTVCLKELGRLKKEFTNKLVVLQTFEKSPRGLEDKARLNNSLNSFGFRNEMLPDELLTRAVNKERYLTMDPKKPFTKELEMTTGNALKKFGRKVQRGWHTTKESMGDTAGRIRAYSTWHGAGGLWYDVFLSVANMGKFFQKTPEMFGHLKYDLTTPKIKNEDRTSLLRRAKSDEVGRSSSTQSMTLLDGGFVINEVLQSFEHLYSAFNKAVSGSSTSIADASLEGLWGLGNFIGAASATVAVQTMARIFNEDVDQVVDSTLAQETDIATQMKEAAARMQAVKENEKEVLEEIAHLQEAHDELMVVALPEPTEIQAEEPHNNSL